MNRYEVIGLLGEGSFGRVYKARRITDSSTVALKVISKRGRHDKEVKGFRRECEIQKNLQHPNIIQMLDSFETENEIVVITEYAHRQLNVVLNKEGYLAEKKVQQIVWDLVSALYYLHSHRVLHRDLKPQNILLDSKNTTKLCDFGFARNMSIGTHVLTSIKGTPLYMAPELIDEHPYDHTADLWSLGCITYELLVGAPPFCTSSILHLIRMIRHEDIQWPIFISDACISFLKGLLQKDPVKRLSWPELLNHPFVKGHLLVLSDMPMPTKPLTRPMSSATIQAKELQRESCITQKTGHSKKQDSKLSNNKTSNTTCNCSKTCKSVSTSGSLCEECKKLSENQPTLPAPVSLENETTSKNNHDSKTDVLPILKLENLNLSEDSTPIENEEWIVFLQKTIEEVISGEMASVTEQTLANIAIAPLRNSTASSKVLAYVAMLFSLPFVVPTTQDAISDQIKDVYFNIKLLPNLVYASNLLMKRKRSHNEESDNQSSEITEDDLYALEHIFVLVCQLVYTDVQYLNQFCDSIIVLNNYCDLHNFLLLSKRKFRIVIDLLAILTHILHKQPENAELVQKIILCSGEFNFNELLKHSNTLLRERSCNFLRSFGKCCNTSLESLWNISVRETLEALIFDSCEYVRNAAETTVEDLKLLPFFYEK